MPSKVIFIVLLVAGSLALSGCLEYRCSLNPPVADPVRTDVPLKVSTYSFTYAPPGDGNEAFYTAVLEQLLASHGAPPRVPLEDSAEVNHHLHVAVYGLDLDYSGLAYIGYLTLFLVPLSQTFESAFVFEYVYYTDGVPARKSTFRVRQKVTQWLFSSGGLDSADALGRGQQLRLFEDCTKAFLSGSGGHGAQLDGLASLETLTAPDPSSVPRISWSSDRS